MKNRIYKSILFFGIGFYDYDNSIIEELNRRGTAVEYIKTVPDRKTPRFLNRIGFKRLSSSIVSKEINRKILNVSNNIDCIFIIVGDNMDERHFSLLKEKFPNIPIILYLWDDIKRVSNYDILEKNCSHIFTFDAHDSKKYNLILRPLFFRVTSSMKPKCESIDKIIYDISFVGWHHTLRYPIISRLRREFDKKGINYKFLLLGRKWHYYIERYLLRTIKKEDQDLFIFNSLSYDEYINITDCSRTILDIPHPGQKGLTIRTIESLALCKKIVTTNADIKEYGFHEDNYRIICEDNPSVDYDFLKKNICINEDMSRYSISHFIDDIFGYED